jgi:Putative prokaryotic signal transducing protein
MDFDRATLITHFAEMSDEALLSQYCLGSLTETASTIALEEIRRRNLSIPSFESPVDEEYAGDYETVARFLNPTDAYVVRSCLEAAGVPAIVADAQLVQVNSLWAPALGGARLMVPALHVAEAKEVIAAFNSGAFALSDDEEPT